MQPLLDSLVLKFKNALQYYYLYLKKSKIICLTRCDDVQPKLIEQHGSHDTAP